MPDSAPDPLPDAASLDGDRSVSLLAANVFALAFVAPVVGLAVWAFQSLWGMDLLGDGLDAWVDRWTALLGALVGGTLVHELLHAITWRAVGRVPAGSVRLGFTWRALTPYAHCAAPMPARAYRIAAAVPGVVLGLVPLVFAVVRGGAMLFWFGLLFTIAAGGDALILWLLRGVPPDALVEDHPSRAGCLVVDRPTPTGTPPTAVA